MKFAVVVKTYNEAHVLDRCIECLQGQTYPFDWIVILDAGSRDTAYVEKHRGGDCLDVRLDPRNLGYSVGNNLGAQPYIDRADYIVFLNPDAFLPPEFLAQLNSLLEARRAEKIGVLGPRLRRYNLSAGQETQVIDTTGIFHRWHGRWFDRAQGEIDDGRYAGETLEIVPAICGAAMICSTEALRATQLSPGEYFRASFFMYKEDIELSLRIRERGFQVVYAGHLLAHHCRGWQSRRKMARRFRLMSAAKRDRGQLAPGDRSPTLQPPQVGGLLLGALGFLERRNTLKTGQASPSRMAANKVGPRLLPR